MKISCGIKKVFRFCFIYGVDRTLFKVAGRSRKLSKFLSFTFSKRNRSIGLVGCGQFGFATIGYFISRFSSQSFLRCYDVDIYNQKTFEAFYKCKETMSYSELLEDENIKCIYIASNHATHTDYAIKAIESGKNVYVEKPLSVSFEQFRELRKALEKKKIKVYSGYNRPHSKAISVIKNQGFDASKPMSVSFFISGHMLDDDHWYRDPEEGTRICGNVGHWLDLTVHMLSWGVLPDKWKISLSPSSDKHRDEDVAINLISERGDLVNILLTARMEPFEGINESINIQWDNMIAKIDDFRRLQIWQEDKKTTKRFWPKDVGHKKAILQPFSSEVRDWKEIELSTLLMLHIKTMVVEGVNESRFSFSYSFNSLVNT